MTLNIVNPTKANRAIWILAYYLKGSIIFGFMDELRADTGTEAEIFHPKMKCSKPIKTLCRKKLCKIKLG